MVKDGKAELTDKCIRFLKPKYYMYSKSHRDDSMHIKFIDDIILSLDPGDSEEYYELPYKTITSVIKDGAFYKSKILYLGKWPKEYARSIKKSPEYHDLVQRKEIGKLKKNIGKILRISRLENAGKSDVYLYDTINGIISTGQTDYSMILLFLSRKYEKLIVSVHQNEITGYSDWYDMCVALVNSLTIRRSCG